MSTTTTSPVSEPALSAPASAPVQVARHGRYEDAQALFSGSLFVGIAMMMYAQAGLLTGSTAGLAFVLHYATGLSFGGIYFLINIPFYWFAWKYVGREFTVKTFLSVALLSVITEFGPHSLVRDQRFGHPQILVRQPGQQRRDWFGRDLFAHRFRLAPGSVTATVWRAKPAHWFTQVRIARGVVSRP